ncbi:MAG: S-layer homology domain-containing protein [Oscillospiraceae bacterium]|nr:S-layer homology domain-containing protein [Oscillospiraceae bacterium]
MAKKKGIMKALSVGLSLAMCASMVAPAFAARDITQEYIDGLAQSSNGTSIVLESDDGVFNMTENVTTEHTLTFGAAKSVEFNMNGHTLTYTKGEGDVLYAEGTDLTVNGGRNEDGSTGKIEGTDTKPAEGALGSTGIDAILGSLTVKDVELTGLNQAIEYAGGDDSYPSNGNDKKAVLENVVAKDNINAGEGSGGTINITQASEVTLTNVEISGNAALNGGLLVDRVGELNMENVSITGNTAEVVAGTEISNWVSQTYGGGIHASDVGKINMKDVEITGNTADYGGGMYAWNVNEINMDGVDITGNTANVYGGGMYIINDGLMAVDDYNPVHWYSNGSTEVNAENTVIAGNKWYGGSSDNDVFAWGYAGTPSLREDENDGQISELREGGGEVKINVGTVIRDDGQKFDGWGNSATYSEFKEEDRIGAVADENGIFVNSFAEGGYAWMTSHWITPPEEPETPDNPVTDPTVEIDDVDVPLAGIFTRADAIGYLWEQSGSPEWELSDFEDVPEDHYWAVAIGWAQDMGIAVADEDGNFRPDDLVLRSTEDIEGELQEFLNRYAVYAGIELDEGELFIELAGSPDDVIMGEEAQVIFDDFFAKLEAALAQAA